MNELFDDELRRRLKAYTEEPDPRLWESVASKIGTGTAPRRKRPWILWIALGLIIPAGLYILPYGDAPTNPSTSASLQDQAPIPAKDEPARDNDVTVTPQESTSTVLDIQEQQQQKSVTQIANTENTIDPISYDDNVVPAVDKMMNGSATDGVMSNTPSTDPTTIVITYETGELSPSVDASPSARTERADTTKQSQPYSEEEEKQKRPLNLYFTIMPTMAYNRIEPNENDNLIIESIDRLAAFSTERLGVRAELGVEHPIGQRFRIFGGLVYFQRDQTIGYTEKLVTGSETTQGPNGEIIITPEFDYAHKSFDHEVRNLGLQIGINYQVRNAKFLHTAGTGIEFHRALNKSRPEQVESMANPTAYVFYNLYYRLQYPAQTRLRAVLQPTLNYSFYINEDLNAPFYIKPYGLGLNIGATYNFMAGYR